jgi:DNA polymerase-3 subunit epsilon
MTAIKETLVDSAVVDQRCPGAPTAAEMARVDIKDSHPIETEEVKRVITLLETSGQYRILRRIKPRPLTATLDGMPSRRGVFLDVETTGLDPALDEIIELAMLSFDYSTDGRICGVGESYDAFRDPGRPIPPAVTALTGITDIMVAGKSIDVEEVSSFVRDVDLVIAHNAEFDRRFCERLCGVFAKKAWACSYREIGWSDEGFDSARLGHLANGHGLFFDAHRALDDCRAGLEILSRPLLRSGRLAFAVLLDSARKARHRVWACGAPFGLRATLKARGYRWSDGSGGLARAWYIDVDGADLESEFAFLRKHVYRREDVVINAPLITAFDRYSNRS